MSNRAAAAVYINILERLRPELATALHGTSIEKDVDAVMMLCRLEPRQQVKLVYFLFEGLLPEVAVDLMASGHLPGMLDESVI